MSPFGCWKRFRLIQYHTNRSSGGYGGTSFVHRSWNSGQPQNQSRPSSWRWVWWLGGGYLSYRAFREYRRSVAEQSVYDIPAWKVALFRTIPLGSLTCAAGWLASREVPHWLRNPLYGTFAWIYGCKMEEAQYSHFTAYKTFNEFFTRALRPGVRSINQKAAMVSPVDGQFLAAGVLRNPTDESMLFPEQIKGVRYPLTKLLADFDYRPSCSNQNHSRRLYYCTLYLSPGSYHRFHCPIDGFKVESIKRVVGDALPVAPWLLRWIPGLVSLNERVVIAGKWPEGRFWMVPVGATNVKSINLSIKEGQCVRMGEEMGRFEMGSLVALIFEAPPSFQWNAMQSNEEIRLGQGLVQPNPSKRFLFF